MRHLYRRSVTEKSCDPLLFGLWILNKTVEKCVSISGRIMFVPEVCLWVRMVINNRAPSHTDETSDVFDLYVMVLGCLPPLFES